ncbi:hypothetical protein ABIB49_000127 [Arthrobacter sp. UYCu512]
MHERAIFPDFSAFQMTMSGGITARHTAAPPAGEDPGQDPAADHGQGLVSGPEPRDGDALRRLNTPPFSWLGSDAWPTVSLRADEPC